MSPLLALLCIALHCIALHCIALLCIALLCIALHLKRCALLIKTIGKALPKETLARPTKQQLKAMSQYITYST